MELKALVPLALLSLVLAGCLGAETKMNEDEARNFKEGMSAERVKEVGPPPTPPSGPMEGYKDGSAADKAQGR